MLSVFTFTNPGPKNLYVLSAKGSRSITIEFSRRAVPAGATDSIVLRYTPSTKGPFKENVEVILSALDKPVKLEISGNIKNYNQDFLTSCYRFGTSPTAGVFRFEHTGTVIDAVTGKPIPGATVQLVDIGGLRGTLKTNRGGTYSKEVTPGLYEFVVTAPNYIGVYHEQYVNPQKPDITFKLEPLKPEEILVVNTPVQEPEPIGEIPAPGTTTTPPAKPTTPTPPTPATPVKPVAKEGELSYDEFKPNNVVFLIDVSGSMKDSLKLPLLKQSMVNLLGTLRPIDRLSNCYLCRWG
ncbi:MAG: carboxypeptidase regulatory-like domain-containing protein [Sphingobacteriales bacterium JAD_PAG50586_3]|nr:MAG: carboxypeptidase regulatory-like domain-containing protein [Sphingobacteriales bacterium JAD_PAG50586_3]